MHGASSAYQSAKRLGHSVVVAEKNYAGLMSDLPRDAGTHEVVMGIKDLAEKIATEGRLPVRELLGALLRAAKQCEVDQQLEK